MGNNLSAQLDFLLEYEIRSSWWASYIGWDWGKELSGRYFANKVTRKYKRYKRSLEIQKKLQYAGLLHPSAEKTKNNQK